MSWTHQPVTSRASPTSWSVVSGQWFLHWHHTHFSQKEEKMVLAYGKKNTLRFLSKDELIPPGKWKKSFPGYNNLFCSMESSVQTGWPLQVSALEMPLGKPSEPKQTGLCRPTHVPCDREDVLGQLPEQESLGLRCAHYRQAAVLSSDGNTPFSSSILTHKGKKNTS